MAQNHSRLKTTRVKRGNGGKGEGPPSQQAPDLHLGSPATSVLACHRAGSESEARSPGLKATEEGFAEKDGTQNVQNIWQSLYEIFALQSRYCGVKTCCQVQSWAIRFFGRFYQIGLPCGHTLSLVGWIQIPALLLINHISWENFCPSISPSVTWGHNYLSCVLWKGLYKSVHAKILQQCIQHSQCSVRIYHCCYQSHSRAPGRALWGLPPCLPTTQAQPTFSCCMCFSSRSSR